MAELKHWWKFEDDVIDSIGSSNGIWTGTSVYENGKIGRCADFSTTNDQTIETSIENYASFSFSCWIYRLGDFQEWFAFINGVGTFASLRDWGLWTYEGAGDIGFHVFDSNDVEHTFGNVTIPLNEWTHVAGTYDGTTGNFYINGDLVGSASHECTHIQTDFQIGGRANAAHSCNAYLDDLKLYSGVLTVKEVKELAKAKVAHYYLNDAIEGTTNLITPNPSLTESIDDWLEVQYPSGTYDPDDGLYYDADIGFRATGSLRIQKRPGDNTQTYARESISGLTDGETYTFSAWVKSSTTYAKLDIHNGTSWASDSHSGSNEWELLQVTTTLAGTTSVLPRLAIYGNTSTSTDAWFNWAQFEHKNHATEFTEDTREYSTIIDSSGYNNSLTQVGDQGISFSPDGAIFDGASWLTCPNNDFVGIDGAMSIYVEFKCASNLTDRRTLVTKAYFEYELDIYITGRVHTYTSNAGGSYDEGPIWEVQSNWGDNEWHRLLWIKGADGNEQLWVDGALISGGGIYGQEGVEQRNYLFNIGARYNGSLIFEKDDMIRNVQVFATDLPSEESLNMTRRGASLDDGGNLYTDIREPRSIVIKNNYQEKNVYSNTYRSMGNWSITNMDVTDFEESDNTLGNTRLLVDFYTTSTTYVPTTFEWCRLNNEYGVQNAIYPESGTWEVGWNKCYMDLASYKDLGLITWFNMSRLEIYRTGDATIPVGDESNIFAIKNIRIIKNWDNGEFQDSKVSKYRVITNEFVEELGYGLEGYWLNDATDKDLSINNRRVIFNSNYNIVGTPYGDMIELDNVDVRNKLSIENSSDLFEVGPMTVSVICSPYSIATNGQYILNHYNWSFNTDNSHFRLSTGRYTDSIGPQYSIEGTTSITDNEFYTLTLIYAPDPENGNGYIQLWIDDELQGTSNIGVLELWTGYGSDRVEWGNSSHGLAAPFYGLVGPTKIFNRILSPTEIKSNVIKSTSTHMSLTQDNVSISGKINEVI